MDIMKVWMLLWMLVAFAAGENSPEDGHARVRRAACNDADTFTIQNLIKLVEKIEQQTSWNFDDTTNALREKGYPGLLFDTLCGRDGFKYLPGLSTKELEQLTVMIQHPDPEDHGREQGVVRTAEGDTIAFGHVLTGICAGIKRDYNFETSVANAYGRSKAGWFGGVAGSIVSIAYPALDNLHAATLAGDLGQTCVLSGCALGTKGTWNDGSCPMKYNLTGTSNEATKAEIMGDIHGFILGIIVPQMMAEINPLKLSSYLDDFYLRSGLGPNGKFRASRSIQLFKEVVSEHRLTIETRAFNELYAARYDDVDASSEPVIKGLVGDFFQLDFMKPCNGFPETHKISYFISLVEELERQSGNPSLRDMVQQLWRLAHYRTPLKQGFEWYIAFEIMRGFMNYDTQLERGVLMDNGGTTLHISHVLNELHYYAVTGIPSRRLQNMMALIARYYNSHQQIIIGSPGAWEGSCPKQHRTTQPGSFTHATFIGAVDGIVLTTAMKQYLKDNPSAKLSTMLSEYYGTGLAKQSDIRSSKRFEHVHKVFAEIQSQRGKRQTSTDDNTECFYMLSENLQTSCEEVATLDDLPLKKEDCGVVAQKVCYAFTQAVKQELKAGVQCEYGDIMKLKPKGASTKTGGNYGAGVPASYKIMASQISRANKYKDCFVKAGKATGIQPALIAALASRETRVYDIDDRTLLNIDGTSAAANNDGYGMMQCDPASGIKCKTHGPDSCEHVQQVIEEILLPNVKGVRTKQPKWTAEQQLQGAVAAYNFGVKNVQTWGGLDVGSSGDDYSGDVIARAHYLICEQGWKYCGESCPQKTGSLPSQGLLQQKYPYLLGEADLHTRFARAAEPAADALRISIMFNNIPGHQLDHRIPTSQTAHDGTVYYGESRKLREYLNDRYGYAESASSISEFDGKPGILFVKDTSSNNGVMGLWDGKQVFHMDDFTGQGSQLYLWSTGKDCRLLAENGDCEFYIQCLEQRLQCGKEGYPIGYGYKFCNRFAQFLDDFNDKGKKWVADVRVCLKQRLLPTMANPSLACSKLKELAFKSHVPCYVDSGFCEMIKSPGNVIALMKVIGWRQFLGPDRELALQQVGGVIARCVGIVAAITKDMVSGYIDSILASIKEVTSPVSQEEPISAACVGYANAGDCKFYECFERRHKCKRENGFSYLLQFELPCCQEFNHKAVGFKLSGTVWLTSYQKCLMEKLLPLYRSDSVNCEEIGLVLKQHRASCMVEADFCGMIQDKPNEWFIDRATYDHGYPLIQRYRSFTYPLSQTPAITDNFYYQGLDQLKYDIAYARKTCTGSLSSGPDMYSIIYSKQTGKNMKVKNAGF